MRKVIAVVVSLAFGSAGLPAVVVAQGAGQGGLQGVAQNAARQPLPEVRVQVRNAQNQVAGQGTTNATGQFSFSNLPAGNYTVEILNSAGQVVGTSTVTVTAGAVATVSITAAAATAIAAGATAGGLLGLGTLGTVGVLAGAAALTTAVIVANRDDASPSR